MTGRRRKDPTGAELDRLNIKLASSVKEAARRAAVSHGLTLTDYLSALIAADIGSDELSWVPGLQEVLAETA